MTRKGLARRGLIAGGLVVWLTGGLLRAFSATQPDTPPASLRIAYLKATNDLALAKAHGALETALAPRGIIVTWAGPFPAAAPALEALNADAADITVGSSTAFILARAAGADVVMFGYQKLAPGGEAIVVPDGSPIRSLADLAGHTVAANRGGTGEYLLQRALAAGGVARENVRAVYLSPPDAGSAFVNGAVDAWAIWDPFLSIALTAYGARVLADGQATGSENAVAYFARGAFARAYPDVLAAVLRVLMRENFLARARSEDAGMVWVRELRLPETLAARLGANNTPLLGPVGPAECAQVERVADWYHDHQIVPTRAEVGSHMMDLGPSP